MPASIAPDPLASLTPPMRWLIERAAPDEPALAMLNPQHTLEQLYATWVGADQVVSAIRLIAAILPNRESIWWAWVSARYATQMEGGTAPSANAHATLAAVEQWIVRPDDAARRAAFEAGEKSGLDSPIGLVATAVFLSGTTIAPPSVPAVPPPPGVAMPLVAGAILLAAVSNSKSDLIPPTFVSFAAQGLEIVKRLGGWDTALQLAHDTHRRQQAEYEQAINAPAPR
ncbi:DUF6931 family protein [Gemmatimonas groenlandica]|uniref:Uncharacterized protein n=1 Tax=Gemmatimonas groenlandica TaxID=2732249 RepID=A0A6M4IRY9_9BACT|nr:hypothetical protein [Gemmatimonas groenlandica]QJR36905.1 hypothetical protein HKW67_15985 [Gemmatimonas groenlandica]